MELRVLRIRFGFETLTGAVSKTDSSIVEQQKLLCDIRLLMLFMLFTVLQAQVLIMLSYQRSGTNWE